MQESNLATDDKPQAVRGAAELPKIYAPCESDAGVKCGNWPIRVEMVIKIY